MASTRDKSSEARVSPEGAEVIKRQALAKIKRSYDLRTKFFFFFF
jgi:hypothetical protein